MKAAALLVFVLLMISFFVASLAQLGESDSVKAITNSSIGQREVTWTISNMFEMYQSDLDYNRSGGIIFEELGRHKSVDGTPSWYPLRSVNYAERMLRDTYPHIFYHEPYSALTHPDTSIGYVIWAPYRMYIDAKNVTDAKTRSGDSSTNTAIYVPDLDANITRENDGCINATFYGTYMTTSEVRASGSSSPTYGEHFSRWFFGTSLPITYYTMDDGYLFQLMAKVQYSRAAAMSYLGWDGTGDVRDWFNSSESALEASWYDYWTDEGGAGGWADIYTAYDFSLDLRQLALKLDVQNSTSESPTILMWSLG